MYVGMQATALAWKLEDIFMGLALFPSTSTWVADGRSSLVAKLL